MTSQKIVNLTPHALNIFDELGENQIVEIPPSGKVARCALAQEKVGEVSGIPLFASQYGEVEGLPEAREDTILVVSMLVRSALPERTDLASPGQLLRDGEGQPLGCKGLTING